MIVFCFIATMGCVFASACVGSYVGLILSSLISVYVYELMMEGSANGQK